MQSDYCLTCKNYIIQGTCLAFPDGIPEKIYYGEKEHDKPTPEQENEIVYEPI